MDDELKAPKKNRFFLFRATKCDVADCSRMTSSASTGLPSQPQFPEKKIDCGDAFSHLRHLFLRECYQRRMLPFFLFLRSTESDKNRRSYRRWKKWHFSLGGSIISTTMYFHFICAIASILDWASGDSRPSELQYKVFTREGTP